MLCRRNEVSEVINHLFSKIILSVQPWSSGGPISKVTASRRFNDVDSLNGLILVGLVSED